MRHPKDLSRRQFLARGRRGDRHPDAGRDPGRLLEARRAARAERHAARDPDRHAREPGHAAAEPGRRSRPTPRSSRGPLVLYNWADYIWKNDASTSSRDEYGVDVEITTFNNMEEGIQKVANGQVKPDVFVPTPAYLAPARRSRTCSSRCTTS